jgi:L1 cell adhesion molecule like protein
MKNTLNEEKLKAHFTAEDKSVIEAASASGLQFLESDPTDAAAIEAKQKEIEAKFNPIMMRVYQAAGGPAGGAGMPGGMGVPGGAPTGGSAPNADMEDLD